MTKHALLTLGLTLLSTPALAIEHEKCWSDTLYRQYDCPAVGWPYGTITQEQGPIFVGKDWPVTRRCQEEFQK
jgi:hypothetical protein